ncbi:MAG TPA: hypothetical protein VIE19_00765 [Lapillicoccus sp.]
MTTRPRRLVRSLAGAGALILLPLMVGACGGGDPVTPRTTTITVTPSAGGASTSATSSTTPTAAATPPKTYEQAMQHFATGRVDAAAKAQFTSPTGNIYCSISASGDVPPGCEVRDGRVAPPAGTCDSGGGAKDVGRIEWQGDTPKPVCNSDTMIRPGAPVLQYSSIATAQGSPFRCLSETIGMTCLNTAAKKGFFLAKGAYTLF